MPREKARPNCHNMDALRLVVEGEGAATIVDGKSCPIQIGNLIIAPAMTWHKHVHKGTEGRVVWMDLLDAALVRHLQCVHFQPGPTQEYPALPPERAFTGAGFVPT